MNTVRDILCDVENIKVIHIYHNNHVDVYLGDYDITHIADEILDIPFKKYELVTLYNDKDVRLNVWM
jgi:hypothetical protein